MGVWEVSLLKPQLSLVQVSPLTPLVPPLVVLSFLEQPVLFPNTLPSTNTNTLSKTLAFPCQLLDHTLFNNLSLLRDQYHNPLKDQYHNQYHNPSTFLTQLRDQSHNQEQFQLTDPCQTQDQSPSQETSHDLSRSVLTPLTMYHMKYKFLSTNLSTDQYHTQLNKFVTFKFHTQLKDSSTDQCHTQWNKYRNNLSLFQGLFQDQFKSLFKFQLTNPSANLSQPLSQEQCQDPFKCLFLSLSRELLTDQFHTLSNKSLHKHNKDQSPFLHLLPSLYPLKLRSHTQ